MAAWIFQAGRFAWYLKRPRVNAVCWSHRWAVSDVILWSQSPFAAWMERLWREHKPHAYCAERDPPDDFALLLARKGEEWEKECWERVEPLGAIYQAEVSDDMLRGFVDFLVPSSDGRYEVWDAKLATTPRPNHILQLCCYADLLRSSTEYQPAQTARLLLRNDKIVDVNLPTYESVWRRARMRFEHFAEAYERDWSTIPAPMAPASANGRWSKLAERLLADDVSNIYGVSKATRRKLRCVGVETIDQLAKVKRVPGLRPYTLSKLKKQAALQRNGGYMKLPTARLLPHATHDDYYFDIEGDPLCSLEYLWGFYDGDAYVAAWAHEPRDERRAVQTTLQKFRRSQRQGGKCYHYGMYELAALRRLVLGDPYMEAQVEDLVRQGYFVDLYDVVKRSLMIGQPSYSLKAVERLYRPPRDEAVQDAVSSVVSYEAYLCTRDPKILDDIQQYNRDDCLSTYELAEWLRQTFGTIRHDEQPPIEKEELRQGHVQNALSSDTSVGWLEYHRRENRPLWRQRFEWLDASPDELANDERCVGMCKLKRVEPASGRKRNSVYVYSFPAQPTRLTAGDRITFRDDAAHSDTTIGGTVCEVLARSVKISCSKTPPARCSLIPDEFVNPEPLPTAISRNLRERSPALAAFVERRKFSRDVSNVETADDIAETVLSMKQTTLAIHGPPGTGKTYCAAHAIARLLKAGYKVAVTAPSHATIENVLVTLLWMSSCDVLKLGGSVGGDIESPSTPKMNRKPRMNPDVANNIKTSLGPLVVGATAWALANPLSKGLFDYVFVDEAGQFPAANLAAISSCASNIVLVGDHAQLPAPSRGAHPAGSGDSCLDHLLKDDDTVPRIFLRKTRRLHPKLCAAISDLFYNGKLLPHADTEQYVLQGSPGIVSIDAGLVFTEIIDHSVDSIATANAAEAAAVAVIAADLLRHKSFQDRPLDQDDILVVAPYNAHVRAVERALQKCGLGRIKVGTVDRFQGKQAAVVIASLCVSASDYDDAQDDLSQPETASRGLSFVLDPRRLNVALSRAQALAVLLAAPSIVDASFNSIDAMRRIALFARLRELAHITIQLDNIPTPPRRPRHGLQGR